MLTRRSAWPRGVALLAAGAYAVHHARVTAVGEDAGGSAASPVHDYVPLLAGTVLVLVLAAAIHFVRALLRARAGADAAIPASAPSLVALWRQVWLALVAVHLVQELAEGLSAGGAAGPIGGTGLLVALLVAAAVALAIAWTLHAADRALLVVAGRFRPCSRRRRPPALAPRSATVARPRGLACHLAGRAPPTPA